MQEIVKVFNEKMVRIMDKDGEPWFVAKDVCEVLDIKNSRDAILYLDNDEKDDVGITDAIGRNQSTTIISESGLYHLIFKSRKKKAQEFRRWVTSEVIPSIRKTGAYVVPGDSGTMFDRVINHFKDHYANVAKENIDLRLKVAQLECFKPRGQVGDISEVNGLPKWGFRAGCWTSKNGRSYTQIAENVNKTYKKIISKERQPDLFDICPA